MQKIDETLNGTSKEQLGEKEKGDSLFHLEMAYLGTNKEEPRRNSRKLMERMYENRACFLLSFKMYLGEEL